jgi:hypothetical protein
MMLADEITPLSRASKLAALAEWAKPRSSACRISSFESRGYPSHSATVFVWAGSDEERRDRRINKLRSLRIGEASKIVNLQRLQPPALQEILQR